MSADKKQILERLEKLEFENPKAIGVGKNCVIFEWSDFQWLITQLRTELSVSAVLEEASKQGYEALFLLMKRVTKLGEIHGEPDSPIDKGWKACDKLEQALTKAAALRSKGGAK
jgi:hypothetical protein